MASFADSGSHRSPSEPVSSDDTDLRSILQALPKVDLHRHLEGSLRLETLAGIAREHGVNLPSYELEQLRPYVQVTEDYEPDFHRFLEKFRLLRRFYATGEAIERIAYEAVADAALDNIKYLELRFNPVALAHEQRFEYHQVLDWVWEGVRLAQADHDIIARLIVSLTRQEPGTAESVFQATLEAVEEGAGIVALDLSGDEVNYPLTPFLPLFCRARDAGLGLTVHAGEAGSAHNVREALEMVRPERLGHGVHCVQNPLVVELVKDSGVTLEMCLTSNLQTGAVRMMSRHPLLYLYQKGIKVTINTDDPSISDTTLTDEYHLGVIGMGLPLAQLKEMIFLAVQAAFLPPGEKAALEARFRTALGID